MHLFRRAQAGALAGYVHPVAAGARVPSCTLARSTDMPRTECCILAPSEVTTSSSWVAPRLQRRPLRLTSSVIPEPCKPVWTPRARSRSWVVGAIEACSHCSSGARGQDPQTCSDRAANPAPQQPFNLIFLLKCSTKPSTLEMIFDFGEVSGRRFPDTSHSARRLALFLPLRSRSVISSRYTLGGKDES